MADIDLKTATPDTSLPTTGFLFGADSQASASPSVYSTQTVATTLLGSTSLTGGTITTSQPVLDLAQTWNAGAVTFTGLRFNAAGSSDANSAAGSLLMDLQVGGSTKFSVRKDGYLTTGFAAFNFANRLVFGHAAGTGGWLQAMSDQGYSWASTTSPGSPDLFLSRRATANLRLGAADAAAPVAQTLSVQSVVAGTTNTAGANLTITGSQGTGTGAGGSIIFQVAPAGSSGTAQNALATALTIDSTGRARFVDGSAVNPAITSINDNLGGMYFASAGTHFSAGGTNIFGIRTEVRVAGNVAFGFASSDTVTTGLDVKLNRDAANTLALRNGGTSGTPVPQTFRVYNWTDGTNSEFGKIAWSSNVLQIGTEKAGTGTARALEFQTDGTTRLTIGANANITTTGDLTVASTRFLGFTSSTILYAPSNGVLGLYNNATNGFDRLQFGGSTSSFPAIKRSSTTLQARLADDSGFASVQGKLTTDTAYTAGDPTTTGYLVVYDSAGVAYKIPAVAV